MAVDSAVSEEYGVVCNQGFLDTVLFSLKTTHASLFTFNKACNLVDVLNGEIANAETGIDASQFLFCSAGFIKSHPADYAEAICNVVNGFLQCNADGAYIFEYCADSLPSIIGTDVPSGCMQIQRESVNSFDV